MQQFSVILPAAGKSSRFRDQHYKKPFINLNGRAVWLHSAEVFLKRDDVCQVIVVISQEDWDDFHSKFGANLAVMGIDVVKGGPQRADSVGNALNVLHDDAAFVAVHDAARPCLIESLVDHVFDKARETGAAILALPVAATLKRSVDGEFVEETVSREHLWEAQTPQVFRRDILVEAYRQRGDFQPTDEAQLVERAGHRVSLVPGSSLNFKITTKQDLALATNVLESLPKPKSIGRSHPFGDDELWR